MESFIICQACIDKINSQLPMHEISHEFVIAKAMELHKEHMKKKKKRKEIDL